MIEHSVPPSGNLTVQGRDAKGVQWQHTPVISRLTKKRGTGKGGFCFEFELS